VKDPQPADAPTRDATRVSIPLWLVGAVVVAAAGLGYALWPRDEGPRPALEVTPNPLDFGAVPWLSAATKRVTIRNRSREEIVLRDPHFDCSCFSVVQGLGLLRLSPGQSTSVEVLLHSQKAEPGRFHKTLTIESNDPVKPKLDVPVLGTITDFREVSPRQVLFGDVTADSEPVTKTVTVRGGKNWRVAVTGVSTTASWLEVTTTPTSDGAELALTTKKGMPGASKGAVDAQVVMTLDVSGGVGAAADDPPRRYPDSLWARAVYR